MRRAGGLIETIGAVAAGGSMLVVGAGNAALSGDLAPVPLVGTWPLVAGASLLMFGLMSSRSERAGAAAAGIALLPLVLGLSFLNPTNPLGPYVAIPVAAAVLTIAGAILQWRGGGARSGKAGGQARAERADGAEW